MIDADRLRDAHSRLVPGPEPATLRVRATGAVESSFTDHAIPFAKAKRLSKKDAELVGGLIAALRYRIWQVWQEALDHVSAPAPKVGDIWVGADGVSWVIKDVEHKLLGNVHNCLSERAV